jgi:molecular chaperone GrpE (heat shock protein)
MRADLERTRNSSRDEAAARGRADVGQLVDSMGASLVQLVTQAQLHRNGTVPVRVDDVVAVGTRLMRSLRAAGVETLGELGEEVAFDPDRHDLLSRAGAPEVGVAVRIRVVGLCYQDRVLRRAGVELVAADRDS